MLSDIFSKIRLMLITILSGKTPVMVNCNVLDYDLQILNQSAEILKHNVVVNRISSIIEEEMYTGSKGKKVIRKGNSFVLKLED